MPSCVSATPPSSKLPIWKLPDFLAELSRWSSLHHHTGILQIHGAVPSFHMAIDKQVQLHSASCITILMYPAIKDVRAPRKPPHTSKIITPGKDPSKFQAIVLQWTKLGVKFLTWLAKKGTAGTPALQQSRAAQMCGCSSRVRLLAWMAKPHPQAAAGRRGQNSGVDGPRGCPRCPWLGSPSKESPPSKGVEPPAEDGVAPPALQGTAIWSLFRTMPLSFPCSHHVYGVRKHAE